MTTFESFYRLKCRYCARILVKSNELPYDMRLSHRYYPDRLYLAWSGARSGTPWGITAYAQWLEATFHIRDEDSYGSITIAKIKCRGCAEKLGFIRIYNESPLSMRGKVHFTDPEEKLRLERRVRLI